MHPEMIISLLRRRIAGELDSAGQAQLDSWIGGDAQRQALLTQLTNANTLQSLVNDYYQRKVAMNARLHEAIPELALSTPSKVVQMSWRKYVAAAVIVSLIGLGTLYYNRLSQPDTAVVQTTPPAVSIQDIMPGYNRAVLTLSNGKQVELDSSTTNVLRDGPVAVSQQPGELKYSDVTEVRTHTMTTPNGGQYQLVLADGTKVWLNAASSITYPTAFSGKTREVSITGEAFFEVARDKAKPFVVRTGEESIEVVGTSFNVHAYAEEGGMKTSLEEGVVRVGEFTLQPGEAYHQGKVAKTNLQQDVAWKNGYFNFEETDLITAMRQLSRWYDIEVRYGPHFVNQTMGGKMQRTLTLSQVMEAFAALGIRYQMENKTMFID